MRALSLTSDADQYLQRVIGRLQPCLLELEKAVENGDVTVDETGRMRDNLRHASLATTSMYLHADDVRRAKQVADRFAAPRA